MNANTIGITSLAEGHSAIDYTITYYNEPSFYGHNSVGISTNIPKSVMCWGNRTTRANKLSIDRLGSTPIISRYLDRQNGNNLKYVNIAYSVPNSSENFNATISNMNIVLYSTEISTVFN